MAALGLCGLIQAWLKADTLCPGPEACPAANGYNCSECGESFHSRIDPDECPKCESRAFSVERCSECPGRQLEEAMAGGLGNLIQRAQQIRAACELGYTVTLHDVTAEEFAAHRILQEEYLKREAEQVKQTP